MLRGTGLLITLMFVLVKILSCPGIFKKRDEFAADFVTSSYSNDYNWIP